jgi:hypothetical protein
MLGRYLWDVDTTIEALKRPLGVYLISLQLACNRVF